MYYSDFVRALELIDVFKSEDRIVEQNMIDNHLILNAESKQDRRKFFNLYNEFNNRIKKEFEVKEIELTVEEDKKIWDKIRRRMRGG